MISRFGAAVRTRHFQGFTFHRDGLWEAEIFVIKKDLPGGPPTWSSGQVRYSSVRKADHAKALRHMLQRLDELETDFLTATIS